MSSFYFCLFVCFTLFWKVSSHSSFLFSDSFPNGQIYRIDPDGKLIRSIDKGVTWQSVDKLPENCESIAGSADGSFVAVASSKGLFYSENRGHTWIPSSIGKKHSKDIALDYTGKNLVVATDSEILISKTGGVSWEKSPLQSSVWNAVVSDHTGQYVAAASADNGIHTSFDYGTNWMKTYDSSTSVLDLAADKSGQFLAAVTDSGILFSHDYGLSWKKSENLLSAWKSVVSDSSGQFLIALSRDGGAYLSSDYSLSWSEIEFPQKLTCTKIATDVKQFLFFAELQDHKLYFSFDGKSWSCADCFTETVSQSMTAFDSLFQGNELPDSLPSKLGVSVNPDAPSTVQDFTSLFNSLRSQSITQTASPTELPSGQPSSSPTHNPTSNSPTSHPSAQPSAQPKSNPTSYPSTQPTTQPTAFPTCLPTSYPSSLPSALPFSRPTTLPSTQPSSQPSAFPSSSPSTLPSTQPLSRPTSLPSTKPSSQPSTVPSCCPTSQPSPQPSSQPTAFPSFHPSTQPSTKPTSLPSPYPTNQPSSRPTSQPLSRPTSLPSTKPTSHPSSLPSSCPTSHPSTQPTSLPTAFPTCQPSSQPSSQPFSRPTSHPSGQPSSFPSSYPSSRPSSRPSCQPSSKPSVQPTSNPTKAVFADAITFNFSVTLVGVSRLDLKGNANSQKTLKKSAKEYIFLTVPTYVTNVTAVSLSFPDSSSPSSSIKLFESSPTCQVIVSAALVLNKWNDGRITDPIPNERLTTSTSNFTSLLQKNAKQNNDNLLLNVNVTTLEASGIQVNGKVTSRPSFCPTILPSSRPSAQPTIQPSTQPTSSPTQNEAKVVPILKPLVLIEKDKSSISVLAIFTKKIVNPFPGHIYCSAFRNSSLLNTENYVSLIKLNGIAANYLDEDVNVTISALVPHTVYTVYCMVENVLGMLSNFSQVRSTSYGFKTDCCKDITFTSYPSFLYNSRDVYFQASSRGQNVFSFALSYLPQSSVTIRPVFYDDSNREIVSTDWAISPTSLLFKNDSAVLTGSFNVLINSSFTGNVSLFLKVSSGGSRFEYYQHPNATVTQSVPLEIIPKTTVRPPRMLTARFSDNGRFVTVSFDSPTDLGGLSLLTYFSCDKLFQFLNGNSANCDCIWTSSTSFTVSSSASPISASQNGITLLASKVFPSQCSPVSQCPSSPGNTISILPPLNPVSPNIILNMPRDVSGCVDVLIDPTASTGNSGRPWTKISWGITAPNGIDVSLLVQQLNNQSQSLTAFTLRKEMLAATTYYITLTLENCWGRSSSISSSFYKSNNDLIPFVNILGASTVTIKSKQSLNLLGSSSLSPCAGAAGVQYTWSVVDSLNNDVPFFSTSRNPLGFTLPGYSLAGGNTYTVRLTATVTNAFKDQGIGTASVRVRVTSGDVIATISGAKTRLISDSISLSAKDSYDENYSPNQRDISELLFTWNCFSLNVNFYGQDCGNTAIGKTRPSPAYNLYLNYSYLDYKLSPYSFQVIVSSQDGRSSVDSVTINVPAPVEGATRIFASTTIDSSTSTATKVNQYQQLTVKSSVSLASQNLASLRVVWSGYYGSEENSVSDFNGIANSQIGMNFSISAVNPVSNYQFPLVIVSNAFVPGTSVTFRVSVSSRSNLLSYSEITYSVVANPSDGVFSVSPKNGSSLVTNFRLSTSGWIDDSANLPLSYDFKYSLNALDYTIQSVSQLNSANTALPAGDSSKFGEISLGVRVFNIYGAYSSRTSSVFVTVPVVSDSAAAASTVRDYLDNVLDSSSAQQNPDQTMGAVSVAATMINAVNCSLVSNDFCDKKNRLPCQSTPQTCSSCKDGFKGVFGDSNSKCLQNSQKESVRKSISNCDPSTCIYGYGCSSETNECVIPPKECPNKCSNNGICTYWDGNGRRLTEAECNVENTYCSAVCDCNQGFHGSSCSYDDQTFMIRQDTRKRMCQALNSSLSISDPSSSLIDTVTSALVPTFDPYEVIEIDGRDKCFSVLKQIVNLAVEGYLTDSQLPRTDSSTAVQNLWNLISSFTKVGHSADLDPVVSDLTVSILNLLSEGQNGVNLLSSSIKLAVQKISFAEIVNHTLQIPLTAEEQNYDAVPLKITFLEQAESAILNECSNSANTDLHDYFTFSYGAWNNNPFSSSFDTPLIRTQTSTNTTVFTRSELPLFLVEMPFTSNQYFINESAKAKFEKKTFNVTFPVCTEYVFDGSDYVRSLCQSCNISVYTNSSIVFACYELQPVCGNPQTQARRRLASDSGSLQNVFQLGAVVTSNEYHVGVDFSYNPFHIDIAKALPILISIAVSVAVILIGLIYFYQWDINDYNILKYSNTLKVDMIEDYVDIADVNLSVLDDEDKKDVDQIFHAEKQSFRSEGNRRQVPMDASFILQNAFPSIVYAQKLDVAAMVKSVEKASFYDALPNYIQLNDYFSLFNPKKYLYHRFLKWLQAMIQIIFILFMNTLFFYIFYPDRGHCETFLTEGECLNEKNLITENFLCEWKGSEIKNYAHFTEHQDLKCVLRAPLLNVPFILLLAAVTIMAAMPIVVVWNSLLIYLSAWVPNFASIFFGANDIPTGSKNKIQEAQEMQEDGYQTTMYDQRVKRVPHSSDRKTQESNVPNSSLPAQQNLSKLSYINKLPVDEELAVLLESIEQFYNKIEDRNNFHPLPILHHGFISPIQAKILLIFYTYGIDMNFNTVPLTLQQQFSYGIEFFQSRRRDVQFRNTYSSPVSQNMGLNHSYDRLRIKLEKSRQEARELVSFFQSSFDEDAISERKKVDDFSANDHLIVENIKLLQFFVFEQFPLYQKYLLIYYFHNTYMYSTHHLFNVSYQQNSEVRNSWLNLMMWFTALGIFAGGLVYAVYFILRWSVISGGNTFEGWGINAIIMIVEQLFIVQILQYIFIQYVIKNLILPKLQLIFNSVSEKMSRYFNPEENEEASFDGLLGLPLHASFSPVSRACKDKVLQPLIISQIINHLTDYEMYQLKYQLSELSLSYGRGDSNTASSSNVKYHKEVRQWKNYSLFHIVVIIIPLFLVQSMFSLFASLISTSQLNFVLNRFHLISFNVLFSYLIPCMVSLLVIVCYIFYLNAPLVAFIIPLVVFWSVMLLTTPFLWESIYSWIKGKSSSVFIRHTKHIPGQDSLISSINKLLFYVFSGIFSLLIKALFLPFIYLSSTFNSYNQTTNRNPDSQWQRQNIPSFLQSQVNHTWMNDGANEVTSLSNYDSYLMSLLTQSENNSQRDNFDLDGEFNFHQTSGNDSNPDLPEEIRRIKAESSLKYRINSAKTSQNTLRNRRNYLSFLLQSSYDLVESDNEQKFHEKKLLDSLKHLDAKKYNKPRKHIPSSSYDDFSSKRTSKNHASVSSRATTVMTEDREFSEEFSHFYPKHTEPSTLLNTIMEQQESSEADGEAEPIPVVDEMFDPRTIHLVTINSIPQLRYLLQFIIHQQHTQEHPVETSVLQRNYFNLYYQTTNNATIALLRSFFVLYSQPSHLGVTTAMLKILHRIMKIAEQMSPFNASSIHSDELDNHGLSIDITQLSGPNGNPSSVNASPVISPLDEVSIDSTDLNSVMLQFFSFYAPVDLLLSNSERNEIMNDFFQFIILNDFSWEAIPVGSFLSWFYQMIEKIEKYKTVLRYGAGNNSSLADNQSRLRQFIYRHHGLEAQSSSLVNHEEKEHEQEEERGELDDDELHANPQVRYYHGSTHSVNINNSNTSFSSPRQVNKDF